MSSQRRGPRRRRRVRLGPWIWRGLVGALVLGGAGTVGSRAFVPYVSWSRETRETVRLKEELVQAREEKRTLRHEIDLLKSSSGLETEARKLGYIRPGEIPLKVSLSPLPRKARP